MTERRIYRDRSGDLEAVQFLGGPVAAGPIINWLLQSGLTAVWTDARAAWESPDGKQGYGAAPERIAMWDENRPVSFIHVDDYLVKLGGVFRVFNPVLFENSFIPIIEYYNEDTLVKAAKAMDRAGVPPRQAQNVIQAMLNDGLLIRERLD